MTLQGFYPVIMTEDVAAGAEFYRRHFGFETVFEADWYVSLRHAESGHELAILQANHPSVPEGFRTSVAGVLLNFEVEDAVSEYERLVKRAGIALVQDIRDEEWGQRHFIMGDPSGALIDVIETIPATGVYAAGGEGSNG